MSFNHFNDGYSAKETFNNLIQPPASGGTIDLNYIDSGFVQGATDSNENWILPPEEFTPVQTIVYISNTGTGVLTIKDDAGNTIGTVSGTLGEIRGFILSATLAWKSMGGGGGAQTFSIVTATGSVKAPSFDVTGSGAITQDTSITTGVELNAFSGTITTVGSTLAAAARAEFVLTNAALAVGNVVVCQYIWLRNACCLFVKCKWW